MKHQQYSETEPSLDQKFEDAIQIFLNELIEKKDFDGITLTAGILALDATLLSKIQHFQEISSQYPQLESILNKFSEMKQFGEFVKSGDFPSALLTALALWQKSQPDGDILPVLSSVRAHIQALLSHGESVDAAAPSHSKEEELPLSKLYEKFVMDFDKKGIRQWHDKLFQQFPTVSRHTILSEARIDPNRFDTLLLGTNEPYESEKYQLFQFYLKLQKGEIKASADDVIDRKAVAAASETISAFSLKLGDLLNKVNEIAKQYSIISPKLICFYLGIDPHHLDRRNEESFMLQLSPLVFDRWKLLEKSEDPTVLILAKSSLDTDLSNQKLVITDSMIHHIANRLISSGRAELDGKIKRHFTGMRENRIVDILEGRVSTVIQPELKAIQGFFDAECHDVIISASSDSSSSSININVDVIKSMTDAVKLSLCTNLQYVIRKYFSQISYDRAVNILHRQASDLSEIEKNCLKNFLGIKSDFILESASSASHEAYIPIQPAKLQSLLSNNAKQPIDKPGWMASTRLDALTQGKVFYISQTEYKLFLHSLFPDDNFLQYPFIQTNGINISKIDAGSAEKADTVKKIKKIDLMKKIRDIIDSQDSPLITVHKLCQLIGISYDILHNKKNDDNLSILSENFEKLSLFKQMQSSSDLAEYILLDEKNVAFKKDDSGKDIIYIPSSLISWAIPSFIHSNRCSLRDLSCFDLRGFDKHRVNEIIHGKITTANSKDVEGLKIIFGNEVDDIFVPNSKLPNGTGLIEPRCLQERLSALKRRMLTKVDFVTDKYFPNIKKARALDILQGAVVDLTEQEKQCLKAFFGIKKDFIVFDPSKKPTKPTNNS